MEACRNVEIKARVASDNVLEVMKKLFNSPPEVIDQVDYFFNVPQGRLKLRSLKCAVEVCQWKKYNNGICCFNFYIPPQLSFHQSIQKGYLYTFSEKCDLAQNSNKWELIYYDRPDAEGPKLSDYRKVEVEDGLGLLEVLRCSLGVKGQVIKRRLLFMYGQTRIHYDEVENLGTFMELEVMLRENQKVEEGTAVANDILEKLGISKEHFITCAYMDLILGKK